MKDNFVLFFPSNVLNISLYCLTEMASEGESKVMNFITPLWVRCFFLCLLSIFLLPSIFCSLNMICLHTVFRYVSCLMFAGLHGSVVWSLLVIRKFTSHKYFKYFLSFSFSPPCDILLHIISHLLNILFLWGFFFILFSFCF